MNLSILNKDVQHFINSHLKTALHKLVLKGSPFEQVSIQEIATQISAKNKCEKKLPTWFQTEKIYYPPKTNLEQASSEITAQYKAGLISGKTLIDLTGGFGVDCVAFCRKIAHVTHCETNKELSSIVAHNANLLNCHNLETFVGDSITRLQTHKKQYDWLYADPSRRNPLDKKVFLLEDCLPDIPQNLDLLFQYTKRILLKVSPLLDIKKGLSALRFVKEIHLLAIDNELKELLFVLEKDYQGDITVNTINFNKQLSESFNFRMNEPALATFSKPQAFLYEPNAAILKSGGFNQVATSYKIQKLHRHTHLYTSDKLLDQFPGRRFKVLSVLPYDKKRLLALLPDKKANISRRNFPDSVAQIRKRTGIKDGGIHYLFFTCLSDGSYRVLFCSKIITDQ
ncbi:MAG: RsmD family RNA methyltransferase [Lutibacter sp.]|nr:RsmD family RNA methyltransferase [Lutibacter sp.]